VLRTDWLAFVCSGLSAGEFRVDVGCLGLSLIELGQEEFVVARCFRVQRIAPELSIAIAPYIHSNRRRTSTPSRPRAHPPSRIEASG